MAAWPLVIKPRGCDIVEGRIIAEFPIGTIRGGEMFIYFFFSSSIISILLPWNLALIGLRRAIPKLAQWLSVMSIRQAYPYYSSVDRSHHDFLLRRFYGKQRRGILNRALYNSRGNREFVNLTRSDVDWCVLEKWRSRGLSVRRINLNKMSRKSELPIFVAADGVE